MTMALCVVVNRNNIKKICRLDILSFFHIIPFITVF